MAGLKSWENFHFKLSPFERAQKSPFEVPPTVKQI
jgi:hypothetical protein